MGDHSCATVFQVGDAVTVIEDVMKAGKNLKGLSGTVMPEVIRNEPYGTSKTNAVVNRICRLLVGKTFSITHD